MKPIEQQIQELTEELRPYPEKVKIHRISPMEKTDSPFWYIEHGVVWRGEFFGTDEDKLKWLYSPFASTNKAEVEEYADCYRRLKLYQLLGEKAAKEYPVDWNRGRIKQMTDTDYHNGTDFRNGIMAKGENGRVVAGHKKYCVLGGVWFAREEDHLEALKICGIDKAMQEKMAKYGLGGA